MLNRGVVAVAISVLALWTQTSVAGASSSITVSPSSARQGGTVTISGNVPVGGTPSCASGDAVQLTSSSDLFPPDGFGPHATRDASGNFQVPYTIPSTTPPGTYSIGMRCGGGNVGITATLQVTSATGTTLAATGSSTIVGLAIAGIAALISGLILMSAFSTRARCVARVRAPNALRNGPVARRSSSRRS